MAIVPATAQHAGINGASAWIRVLSDSLRIRVLLTYWIDCAFDLLCVGDLFRLLSHSALTHYVYDLLYRIDHTIPM